MRIIIIFILKFILQIAVATVKTNMYSKMGNQTALLQVMKETDARSLMECAAHCTTTDRCRRAQWGASGCELLADTALGGLIDLTHEDKIMYMCEFYVLNSMLKLQINSDACITFERVTVYIDTSNDLI